MSGFEVGSGVELTVGPYDGYSGHVVHSAELFLKWPTVSTRQQAARGSLERNPLQMRR